MQISRHLLPLLLILGLPFFFVGGPGFYSSRSFVHVWDLGHILYFALFTRWLLKLVPERQAALPIRLRLLLLVATPLAVGLVIESLQYLTNGRTPGGADLLRNALGAFLILAFHHWSREEARPSMVRLARGLTLALLALAVSPFLLAVRDEDRARREFPVLADFEGNGELSRWYHANQMRREKTIVRHGQFSGRVQLSTAKISGISLLHFPRDWSGYRILKFSVFNPLPQALELNCRLDDSQHRRTKGPFTDRYNARFMLQAGWNDLAISLDDAKKAPKNRQMDMSHIAGFALFVVEQKEPLALYLDQVRLE